MGSKIREDREERSSSRVGMERAKADLLEKVSFVVVAE
jgi:hypothetical protein